MSTVQINIDQGVATITLNRPEKRNALTREIIESLSASVDKCAADDAARVLVLRSEGKVFCAGMDLGQMQQRAESPNSAAEWHQDSVVYCDLLCKLYELPMPTVAAMQGPALAGGVGLVVACDLVFAADGGFLSLPEPMRGITAAMVSPLLIHRVGFGFANGMLLSGGRVSVQRAAEVGLVYEVLEADTFGEQLDQRVEQILTGSKSALAITKKHVAQCAGYSIPDMIRESATVSGMARDTDDAREGLAAFLEKRKPNWMP